jgi:hypothetical protein
MQEYKNLIKNQSLKIKRQQSPGFLIAGDHEYVWYDLSLVNM